MKRFIPYQKPTNVVDENKLNLLVDLFNEKLAAHEPLPISLNTGLDEGTPTLTEDELNAAVIEAAKSGYLLTMHPDNYQTTTYKIEPIITNL